ncbi:MAG TPA: glycosyltransferase [Bryobacteraceae bacterium]|nr:glycosyltransferase [Bryobacteraceae bacterium]
MKILFLIRSLENGGAERQLAALANELGRRNHDVAVGVFRRGGVHEGSLDPRYVRLIFIDKDHPASFGIRLLRTVRRERPDVLHGYLSAGNIAATLARTVAPRAKLVWGIRDSDMEYAKYSRTTQITYRVAARMARFADLMIFNSDAGLRYWRDRGCAIPSSVSIPNGIDVRRFAPDRAARRRMRAQWGIPEHVPVIGAVGRFDPMKDHETFLRAAALAIEEVPGLRPVIVGGGSPEIGSRLKSLASELNLAGSVVWQAPTQDMQAVYNALDVFCLSSSNGEGFPNVVGEAMACGCRCVVTDVGDAAFVVGSLGTVVPPRDPRALAKAWLDALVASVPRPAEIRGRVVENFTVERLADRTEDVLCSSATAALRTDTAFSAH